MPESAIHLLVIRPGGDRNAQQENAEVKTLQLDQYRGASDDLLKIGTVHRAKGLDFQAVLVVRFDSDTSDEKASEQETCELRDRQHLVAATSARDYLWWGEVVSNQQ